MSEPEVREALRRVALMAMEPDAAAAAPRPRRPLALALAGVIAASLVGAFLAPGYWILVPAVLFLVAGALLVAVQTPAHEAGLDGPEDAVRAYFLGVMHRRWAAAFAALSPFARERPARRPFLPELGSPAASVSLDSPAALRRYWAPLSGRSLRTIRRLALVALEPRATLGGGMQVVRVHLEAMTCPTWAFLAHLLHVGVFLQLGRSFQLQFDVVAVRHGSRHRVLTGELYPGLDRALAGDASTVRAAG